MTRPLASHELLLAEAARLHEKYQAARPEQFNVFSVLRRPGDEVHLHSRFLAALLDHRQGPESERLNLADFLRCVVKCAPLDAATTQVQREFSNIDILIRDDTRAIVIENKIWAEDQHKQLERYYAEMRGRGYEDGNIKLFYLTLDGHQPSDDSLGCLKGKDRVECLSYSGLQRWLERCAQRAYREPALRESIAQYRGLVQKLTGDDYNVEHMRELEKLLGDAPRNLLIANDLAQALAGAKAAVLWAFWEDLRKRLDEALKLPKDENLSKTSMDYFQSFLRQQRGSLYGGLFYRVSDHVHLAVENGYNIYYGVRCHRRHEDERKRVLDALGGTKNENAWWPWRDWPPGGLDPRGDIGTVVKLAGSDDRQEYLEAITGELGFVLERFKDGGLIVD